MTDFIIDLRKGLGSYHLYDAFRFPGGELHFKLSKWAINYLQLQRLPIVRIIVNIQNSEDLMLLCLAVDTVNKDWDTKIEVFLPYMPYQQADRDFGIGESFSLSTVVKMLNSLPVYSYTVFDPHSDVTPALLGFLKRCKVINNQQFVQSALVNIVSRNTKWIDYNEYTSKNLIILSPDAGAYKKIGKLTHAINFKGEVETAIKYRNISNGEINVKVYREDFAGKDIVIIDDICVGGKTFTDLAQEIQGRNSGKKYLIVSHGIFSKGLAELGTYFNGIYTTNSYREDFSPIIRTIDDMPNSMNLETYLNVFQLNPVI
jgi:ribose-phosphate pyrophosphokinase